MASASGDLAMVLAFFDSPVQLVVLLIIALLIFGHKLPSVARSLGTSVSEFKKGVKEGEMDLQKMDAQQAAQAAPPAAAQAQVAAPAQPAPAAPAPAAPTAPKQ
jgi:sec-independent protein translocase protein TatA